MAGGVNLDKDFTSLMLLTMAFIIVELVLEVTSHIAEHKASTHRNIAVILSRMYRELMLLGLVAFLLFVFETTQWINSWGVDVGALHWVHWLVFSLSFVYIISMFALMGILKFLVSRWKLQEEQVNYDKYLELRAEYANLKAMNARPFWWICNPSKRWRLMRLRRQLYFHDAKFRFIRTNRLPDHYPFWVYLYKCMEPLVKRLSHIHWGVWTMLFFVLGIEMAVEEIIDSDSGTSLTFIVFGGILLIMDIAVTYKIQKIMRQLFKKGMVERDGFVNPETNTPKAKRSVAEVKSLIRKVVKANVMTHAVAEPAVNTKHNHKRWWKKDFHTEQEKLFWFDSPKFFIIFIQAVYFNQAFIVAQWLSAVIGDATIREQTEIVALSGVITWSSLLLSIFIIPDAIARYVIISNVGELVDYETLHISLEKGKRKMEEADLDEHDHELIAKTMTSPMEVLDALQLMNKRKNPQAKSMFAALEAARRQTADKQLEEIADNPITSRRRSSTRVFKCLLDPKSQARTGKTSGSDSSSYYSSDRSDTSV